MPSKYPALPALTVAMISLFVACNKQSQKSQRSNPRPLRREPRVPTLPRPTRRRPHRPRHTSTRLSHSACRTLSPITTKFSSAPMPTPLSPRTLRFLRSYSQLSIVIEGRCAERGSQEPRRKAILSRSAFPPTAFAPPAPARNVPSALIATKPAGGRTVAATSKGSNNALRRPIESHVLSETYSLRRRSS
jgi:hypothetical protein